MNDDNREDDAQYQNEEKLNEDYSADITNENENKTVKINEPEKTDEILNADSEMLDSDTKLKNTEEEIPIKIENNPNNTISRISVIK